MELFATAAAELEELKASVVELREAIADLAANGDPSQSGMLRVKIVDARSGLSRRLQQLSPFALRSTVLLFLPAQYHGSRMEIESLRLHSSPYTFVVLILMLSTMQEAPVAEAVAEAKILLQEAEAVRF